MVLTSAMTFFGWGQGGGGGGATGLQKRINILQPLLLELVKSAKRTKFVIFQKQCRQSTREKHALFLNNS